MHIHWKALDSVPAVEHLIERSRERPCLIFKHSTRCSISSLAKHRLEGDWDFAEDKLEPYFLDLIAHRDVSRYVADTFDVHHESPQVLLIANGECYYDASHLDIRVAELHEVYQKPQGMV